MASHSNSTPSTLDKLMLIFLLGGISDASKIPVESDTDDEGAPQISLAEMLEELSLSDATGGEGADMMTE